jgi:tellurium resistance protein TerD
VRQSGMLKPITTPMPINLTKGQAVDLKKSSHDLDQITIGLGWKVREKRNDLSDRAVVVNTDDDFDLDAIAFLLDEHDKVANRGDSKLVGGDVVFFNSRAHPSGTVTHSGDNRTGGSGVSDDEQIVVRLNSVPSQFHRILFLVCIYQGSKLGQHFGQISSAYIRAVDGKGTEIVRYSLSSEAAYEGQCTVVLGEVYRQNEGWKFRAIGDAYPYDSFAYLLKEYLPN